MLKKIVCFFVVAVTANGVWAHPGHGELGLFHHVKEADPWLLGLALALLVFGLVYYVIKNESKG